MNVRGKAALISRWVGMITGKNTLAIDQKRGGLYKKDKIAGYYNDLTGKVNKETILDDGGIAMNIIEGNKRVYFPISIFQYALGLWDLYLKEESEAIRSSFLNHCRWIVENQRSDGSWDCFGPIGYSNYTVSSMGQGEAVSVLARAYILTKENIWIDAAGKAMSFMLRTIGDGGTLLIEGENYYFEEYPDQRGEKRSVLNGWIFSLFGLYDYLLLTDDSMVRQLFWNSAITMEKDLKDYDLGYWSCYDKSGRIASPAYHRLHIELLYVMADLTGREGFLTYAERWSDYQRKKANKGRAVIKKIIQKLSESQEGVLIK